MNLAHFADFCTAWRSCIREGLSANRLFRDTIAGIVVGAISLPLSITFAISSGMSPQAGLYTAIIGGLVAGIFGGSKYQISGPTAAFIVILIPIVREFGPIDFISFPVIAGFTLGIAISVMILQLRSFCGIIAPLTNSTCNEFIAVFTHWENCNAADLILGMFTLGSLFGWSYFVKNIPAALVVLPISCVLGVILPTIDPSFHFDTIANHFTTVVDGMVYHGIPPISPRFEFPWKLHDGMHLLDSFAGLMSLFKGAFTIAVLCAIETLV
ncbi:MAG: hypothetical protein K8R38_03925, partial [Verrucomicrobia bacterium]|nr:hypothetical protein [Verrucomicrobiota bacterium]